MALVTVLGLSSGPRRMAPCDMLNVVFDEARRVLVEYRPGQSASDFGRTVLRKTAEAGHYGAVWVDPRDLARDFPPEPLARAVVARDPETLVHGVLAWCDAGGEARYGAALSTLLLLAAESETGARTKGANRAGWLVAEFVRWARAAGGFSP